jgi:hypothetical protein
MGIYYIIKRRKDNKSMVKIENGKCIYYCSRCGKELDEKIIDKDSNTITPSDYTVNINLTVSGNNGDHNYKSSNEYCDRCRDIIIKKIRINSTNLGLAFTNNKGE